MIKYVIRNIDSKEYLDEYDSEVKSLEKAYLEEDYKDCEEYRKTFDEPHLYETIGVEVTYEIIEYNSAGHTVKPLRTPSGSSAFKSFEYSNIKGFRT